MKHYNRVRNCEFVFDRRLDATGPTSEPEAAYVDQHTGEVLVVERKSLIWPSDFAQLHATSHEIAGIVESELDDLLDSRRAYRLTLRDDLRGPRAELRKYVRAVARAITRRIDAVHGGTSLRAQWPSREWSLQEERASDRDFTEPLAGLIVEFNVRTTELDYGDISPEFAAEFERLLTAAAKKFERHGSARRILVIDPYGDARWSTDETWRKLLTVVAVPTRIQEIWMSMHDMITELHCGWIQQELWPSVGDDHSELCHDPDRTSS